eukprot:2132606-Amphidinium_carterae.1
MNHGEYPPLLFPATPLWNKDTPANPLNKVACPGQPQSTQDSRVRLPAMPKANCCCLLCTACL